ncbi:MAG TPA: FkbM family methyltransferase, partial [Blastocatellia bacterium]|nr:FkbM family methyltransferase [Blastocatellia bacterium]
MPSANVWASSRPSPHSGNASSSGRPRYQLPNGLEIFYLNRNETDFLYQEIFEEQGYFKHGIRLDDGACVFDVGANIGMFTLFVGLACNNPSIYSFEPIPDSFEALRLNAELHGINARVFQCGIADGARREKFTYYPHVSIFSGRFADSDQERTIIKSFLMNLQQRSGNVAALAGEEIDELLAQRFTGKDVVCDLKSISEVIRENKIERIDLLKIDVEKSELDVLAGIEEN